MFMGIGSKMTTAAIFSQRQRVIISLQVEVLSVTSLQPSSSRHPFSSPFSTQIFKATFPRSQPRLLNNHAKSLSTLRISRPSTFLSSTTVRLPAMKKKKVVGRGPAGKGNKCGRGQKGFKARRGAASPNRAFEGGQPGIVKALPKIGPQTQQPIPMSILSVEKVVSWVRSGRLPMSAESPITVESIISSKCARFPKAGLFLVRTTERPIPIPLHIQVNGASDDVIRAIEAVPGAGISTHYFDAEYMRARLHPEAYACVPESPSLPPTAALLSRYANPAKRGYLADYFGTNGMHENQDKASASPLVTKSKADMVKRVAVIVAHAGRLTLDEVEAAITRKYPSRTLAQTSS